MNGKVVYVTGAGRGIGRSIALRLAADGYLVKGSARSLNELQETRRLSDNKIEIETVDTTDTTQVSKWLNAPVNGVTWGLVTSAGVYGPIGPFYKNSLEEWMKAVAINLNGTAIAIHEFSKKLIAAKQSGRIFALSGGGATQPLPNFSSYCAAKAAVVRFCETVAHELKPHGITVMTCAPGAVNTRLTEELLRAGPEQAGQDMYEKALKQKESGGASPDKAAHLASFFMSETSAPITAKLISAVWDKWENLGENWASLENSDIYTLKRITPEDRPQVKMK